MVSEKLTLYSPALHNSVRLRAELVADNVSAYAVSFLN